MAFDVKMLYSPAHELLLSFSLYKRQTQMKYLALSATWPQEVDNVITSPLKERIASKKDLNFEDLSVLFMKECPEETIEGFFKWLQSKTAGNMYELLSPYVKSALPSDLELQRDEFISLLKEWKVQYFDKIDQTILEGLRNDALHKSHLLETSTPARMIQKASRFIISNEHIRTVYLIPGSHYYPMSLIDQFHETVFITYPVGTKESDQAELLRVTKALSDERRIAILRFLSTGIYTFTNIVSEIGMAKGNIHHHLSILRAAGLVDIHITDDPHTFFYGTNPDITSNLSSKLDTLLK
ncbi:ArsR/SmtB family transcription factor [Alkalihalobacillus sp. CinArs1]|uniref:ArsR/SmtB family transcription factor n=1 Tax=Alkalihalobacillus sp. CinArs1 TaxID=2995314 RepID=UPI0022DDC7C9|nr:winged helix-turn-helix domain-containing protein [Alkalihalobacillus sp. CinArs1]